MEVLLFVVKMRRISPGYIILAFILIVSLSFVIATTIVNDDGITTPQINDVVYVTADSASDIQTQVNALTDTGGTIYIPKGVYNFTVFSGDGGIGLYSNTEIICDRGAILTTGGRDKYIFTNATTSLHNVTIKGCYFRGDTGGDPNKNNQFFYLQRITASNILIEDNVFEDSRGHMAIDFHQLIDGSRNIKIINNDFIRIDEAIQVSGGDAIYVEGNYFESFNITSTGTAETIDMNGNMIDVRIIGNTFINYTGQVMDLSGKNMLIKDNYIEYFALTGKDNQVIFSNDNEDSVISNNIIKISGNNSKITYGIALDNSDNFRLNNEVSGNIIIGNSTTGAWVGIQIDSQGNIIHDNSLYNLSVGIDVDNSNNYVTNNKFRGNGEDIVGQYSGLNYNEDTEQTILQGDLEWIDGSGLNENLVSYYGFDGQGLTTDNQTAFDSSNNRFNVTLGSATKDDSAQPKWSEGKSYGALLLDGSNDYTTTATLNTTINAGSGFSVCLWARPHTILGALVSRMTGSNSNVRAPRIDLNLSGSVQFRLRSAGAANLDLVAINPLVNNTWNHICGTYNMSYATLYINGDLQDSSHSIAGALAGGPNSMVFGSQDGSSQFYGGYLDEIRIYNRSLNTYEIEALYQGMGGRATGHYALR